MSPQSTATRSSPDSRSIMLSPISPRPPSGIRRMVGTQTPFECGDHGSTGPSGPEVSARHDSWTDHSPRLFSCCYLQPWRGYASPGAEFPGSRDVDPDLRRLYDDDHVLEPSGRGASGS